MPIYSASRPTAHSFHLHDGVVLFRLSKISVIATNSLTTECEPHGRVVSWHIGQPSASTVAGVARVPCAGGVRLQHEVRVDYPAFTRFYFSPFRPTLAGGHRGQKTPCETSFERTNYPPRIP